MKTQPKKVGVFIYIFFVIAGWALSPQSVHSQACSEPVVTGFSNQTDSSFQVNWFSNNAELLFYEIEFGEDPFIPTGIPSASQIAENKFLLTGLLAGTRYSIYVRSVCSTDTSDWNGPLFFNTQLQNPTQCQTNLVIEDNNCPGQSEFPIKVNQPEGYILGEHVFLSEIHLIIEHDWPADLRISLQNPGGKEITLSSNNGIGFDHYGDPFADSCTTRAIFSDSSCELISAWEDTLTGIFQPEEALALMNDGTQAGGLWNLLICDRAKGDIGHLKYAELFFTETLCHNPTNIFVDMIQSSSVILNWTTNTPCDSITIEYGEQGFIPGTGATISVPCVEQSQNISDLDPDTEYEVYLKSDCSSISGCPFFFKTSCHDVTLRENFNAQNLCISECGAVCEIGGVFSNSTAGQHDWIVMNNNTPTEFTGPQSDVSKFGNYIYIESSGESCSRDTAILESICLELVSNPEECDMSFNFHMNGNGAGTLSLQISQDGGKTWNTIWSKSGNQGPDWNEEYFSLKEYEGMIGKLRFITYGGVGNLNDIAIDQIFFYGSDSLQTAGNTYYEDFDGDGYGNPTKLVSGCISIPPEGFVPDGGDCDDTNPEINPSVEEILCNSVDDNCNGIEDDKDPSNPISYLINSISNETCLGNSDGSISIEISGGQPPYRINWSNGDSAQNIDGLKAGIYTAEISDQNNCIVISDSIQLISETSLIINNLNSIKSSCAGIPDGSISMEISGGSPPYEFLWSSGDTVQNPKNVLAGNHQVTVTDQSGCMTISDFLEVGSNQKFSVQPILVQNARCFGDYNGRINLGVAGSKGPFHFLWNTGDTTSSVNGLASGVYACTVTDTTGCFAIIEGIPIQQPDSLIIQITGLDNIACFDDNNGSIDITAFGGTPPYNYLWSTGSIKEDLVGVSAGTYSITVSDNKACSASINGIRVNQSEKLSLQLDSISHVACPLSSEGYIQVSASGGTGDYQYFWNIPGVTESFLDSLQSNIYDITLIDQFGCKSSLNQIVVKNLAIPLNVDITLIENIQCPSDSNAIIAASVLNGTSPYDFNWSAGIKNITLNSRDTIAQLPSGKFNVTVTDAEGCIGISQKVMAEEIEELYYQIKERQNNFCYGDSLGQIEIQAFGGTAPLMVKWNTGETGLTILNKPAGQYRLTITDANNCQFKSNSITISQKDSITVDAEIKSANGARADGEIFLNVFGGTSPFVLQWDQNANNQIGHRAINLSPGHYRVTITDLNFCTADTVLFVDQVTNTIEPERESKIHVYPNPGSGIFYIDFPESIKHHNIHISLYSPLSQIIQNINYQVFSDKVIQLDLNHLPNSNYWLKIQDQNSFKVLPLVIIR